MLDALEFGLKNPVVPVVVIDDEKDAVKTAEALVAGGIRVAEVTFRTEAAAPAIEAMAQVPGMTAGAGTVINAQQASLAIECGSKFLVSPGFLDEIAEVAQQRDVLYFPGVANPGQVMQALKWDLKVLKFFPAAALGGLPVIKAMSGPFPQVKFMPTGGIKPDNLKEWLSDPRIVACGGTWIATAELIRQGRFDQIKELAQQATDLALEVTDRK